MAPSKRTSKSDVVASQKTKKAKIVQKEEEPSSSDVSSSQSASEDELDELDASDDELDQLDEEKDELDEEEEEEDDDEEEDDKTVDPNKKSSKEQHAEQRKLLNERKLKRKSGIEVQRIKSLWEKLRVKKPALPKDVRDKVCNEIWDLSKDVINDLVLKHDASRVVQTLVKYASKEQREVVVKQLKGSYYKLATSSYGKYLLIKLLHYGSKESREIILNELHGKFRKLMRHKEGAYVVEDLYVLYSTAEQKQQMIREFWGAEYAVFKESGKNKSVLDAIHESAEKKNLISTNLAGTITASVEKGSTGFQVLHAAMRDYVHILADDVEANNNQIREFIELLAEQFAEIVHTAEGSEVACTLIALATAKERKVIIRTLKDHVKQLIKNEYGNTVLITLYMTVDDTVLVHKGINVELFTNEEIPDIIGDKFSRRPLLYLLKGLDGRYFNPKIKQDLHKYEQLAYQKTSKKEQEVRRSELASRAVPLIYKGILSTTKSEETTFSKLLSVNIAAQFISELVLYTSDSEEVNELRKDLIDAIFEVSFKGDVLEDYYLINKTPFLSRSLKSLIQGNEFKWDNESKKLIVVKDKKIPGIGIELAERIAEEIISKGNLADWTSGQGSFVIVSVYEVLKLNDSEVGKTFEKELKKLKKSLKSDNDNKGAQLLVKLLN